jgi:hypothetical protein
VKFAIDISAVAVIYIPSFIKVSSDIQKLIRGYTDTQTGYGLHKPTFFEIKKVDQKQNVMTTVINLATQRWDTCAQRITGRGVHIACWEPYVDGCFSCKSLTLLRQNTGTILLLRIAFGLCPSSGILETRKHNVSETGSVSVLR